jgi:hypothetical protein
MSPRDRRLLEVAAAAAPGRGVRVTARRGVWRKGDGDWKRFENETTIAGFAADLNEQGVHLRRGELDILVLLGDVLAVNDDVSIFELAAGPTLQEALDLSAVAA